MNAILYIHGKGGNAAEAKHYKNLFPTCDVIGLDYKGATPWEAGKEIQESIIDLKKNHDKIILSSLALVSFGSLVENEDNFFSSFVSSLTLF